MLLLLHKLNVHQDINMMGQSVFIIQQDQLFINALADIHGMEYLVFLEEINKLVLLVLIGMENNAITLTLNLE